MSRYFDPPLYLDRDNGFAFQAQITAQIVSRIALGTLRDGEQLPPIRVLARNLRVERKTVVRAYAELARRGLTYATTTKEGTRVCSPETPEAGDVRRKAAARRYIALLRTVEGYGLTAEKLHNFANYLARPAPPVPGETAQSPHETDQPSQALAPVPAPSLCPISEPST